MADAALQQLADALPPRTPAALADADATPVKAPRRRRAAPAKRAAQPPKPPKAVTPADVFPAGPSPRPTGASTATHLQCRVWLPPDESRPLSRLMGPAGATLREVERETGCTLFVAHRKTPGRAKSVNVSARHDSVADAHACLRMALEMVNALLEDADDSDTLRQAQLTPVRRRHDARDEYGLKARADDFWLADYLRVRVPDCRRAPPPPAAPTYVRAPPPPPPTRQPSEYIFEARQAEQQARASFSVYALGAMNEAQWMMQHPTLRPALAPTPAQSVYMLPPSTPPVMFVPYPVFVPPTDMFGCAYNPYAMPR